MLKKTNTICLLAFSLLTLCLWFSAESWASSTKADLVFINGNIITVDEDNSRAQAVSVNDGVISAVGRNQNISDRIGDQTQVIDLKGATLLPGFIDTHTHIFEGASEVGGNCEMSPEFSLEEQDDYLEQCVAEADPESDWVMGYGFQLDALLSDENAMTPRAYLDTFFPEQAVVIMEESSHAMIVNSVAMELAGISAASEQPVGGRIMFDDNDQPNGVLFDNAGDRVMEMAWNNQAQVDSLGYQGLLEGLALMAENGITTVGDGRMYWRRGWYKVWQRADKNQVLTSRVSVRPWIYPDIPMKKQLPYLAEIQSDDTHADLVFNQVKMYVDGVLHFGTAKVHSPYRWSWQESDPNGLYYLSPDSLKAWLPALANIGYGAHIHAVGDKGVTEALNSIEIVRKNNVNHHYGLTHLEMLSKGDVFRFKKLDVDADFQAGATFFAEHHWAEKYIGRMRANALLPMRAVFDTGANVTFSSDWTVNALNPLIAIANSLRYRKQNGLPTVTDAIRAATINGAKALGLEQITGSIEPGKSADLVILGKDISQLSADELEQVKVLMTFYRGEQVHQGQ